MPFNDRPKRSVTPSAERIVARSSACSAKRRRLGWREFLLSCKLTNLFSPDTRMSHEQPRPLCARALARSITAPGCAPRAPDAGVAAGAARRTRAARSRTDPSREQSNKPGRGRIRTSPSAAGSERTPISGEIARTNPGVAEIRTPEPWSANQPERGGVRTNRCLRRNSTNEPGPRGIQTNPSVADAHRWGVSAEVTDRASRSTSPLS
jgi:hypothetical protein